MNLQAGNRSEETISTIMRQVRSKDTTPETLFRKALWAHGLRYRLYSARLPGKPDIVVPSLRLCIFIDGDYWHGGQWVRRRLTSLEEQFSNTRSQNYWLKKIRKNMDRDCSATTALLSDGWKVLRFWESRIMKDLDLCVNIALDVAEKSACDTRYSRLAFKSVAEFFSGIGLIRMALERHGWSVAYANDMDRKKHEMYVRHFEESKAVFHLKDIHEVHPQEIPSVTLATASFPCNDLSLAGSRSGLKGRQSSAFWEFIRLIDGLQNHRPPLILLENVTGFLSSRDGKDFREALLAVNRLGYSVDAFVLDARFFVPQSRPRLFVVGVVDDSHGRPDALDQSTLQANQLRPKRLTEFITSHDDIRWKIRPLPNPSRTDAKLQDIVEDLPDNAPEWWSAERTEYLFNQMSAKHRKIAEHMTAESDWSYATVFRRIRKGKSMAELRADGVAGCLRTPRGGSGRQILFKAGYGKQFARLLTPRECARLMGADNYSLTVPLNQALFGFGDAVCVPVIEWIAQYYLNPVVNELLRGRVLCLPEQSQS
jgi:DNA (cytosine-5)-methyltransferase 1